MPKDTSFEYRGHVIDGAHVDISMDNNSHFRGPSSTLLVSAGPSIVSKISEHELRQFFSRFGRVSAIRKFVDPVTKKPAHYAFVEFNSTDAIEKALGR